jgi:hypothetical protein
MPHRTPFFEFQASLQRSSVLQHAPKATTAPATPLLAYPLPHGSAPLAFFAQKAPQSPALALGAPTLSLGSGIPLRAYHALLASWPWASPCAHCAPLESTPAQTRDSVCVMFCSLFVCVCVWCGCKTPLFSLRFLSHTVFPHPSRLIATQALISLHLALPQSRAAISAPLAPFLWQQDNLPVHPALQALFKP